MDIFYPLQQFANWISFSVLKLTPKTHLAEALNFFIYDSLKILVLLIVINYLMAIIRYYIPTEKIRDFLSKRNWYGFDYFLASFFGVITPFCSCSSIPLFIGFLSAGIPLGVTLAFLITSPLVNEASIAIFIGLFGFKITLFYVATGILIGVLSGVILGKTGLEKEIDESLREIIEKSKKKNSSSFLLKKKPFFWILKKFWQDGWSLTKKIYVYVLIGVGVGALIHGFVPVGFFERYLKNGSFWTVPLATILAIPLYSNAVGVIPIMEALVSKGIPFGTALSFMMATVGLSLPEAMILKRAMKTKLLVLFFACVSLGIVLIGWFFNLIM